MDFFSRKFVRFPVICYVFYEKSRFRTFLTTKKAQPFDRANGIRLRFALFEAFPFQGKLGIIESCIESILFQKGFMGSLFDDVAISHHQD